MSREEYALEYLVKKFGLSGKAGKKFDPAARHGSHQIVGCRTESVGLPSLAPARIGLDHIHPPACCSRAIWLLSIQRTEQSPTRSAPIVNLLTSLFSNEEDARRVWPAKTGLSANRGGAHAASEEEDLQSDKTGFGTRTCGGARCRFFHLHGSDDARLGGDVILPATGRANEREPTATGNI
jgi:hypothetical protein